LALNAEPMMLRIRSWQGSTSTPFVSYRLRAFIYIVFEIIRLKPDLGGHEAPRKHFGFMDKTTHSNSHDDNRARVVPGDWL